MKALRKHYSSALEPASRKRALYLTENGLPFNAVCERKVFKAVADACLAALSTFPTTKKHDVALLAVLGIHEAQKWVVDSCEKLSSAECELADADVQRAASFENIAPKDRVCLALAIRWRIQHKQSIARAYICAMDCIAALEIYK